MKKPQYRWEIYVRPYMKQESIFFLIPHSTGNNDKYVSICCALVFHLKLSEKPLAKLPVVIGPDFACDNSLINKLSKRKTMF